MSMGLDNKGSDLSEGGSEQALADLFALKVIYDEMMFRNDQYISPEKSKAIARLIEELCLEVSASYQRSSFRLQCCSSLCAPYHPDCGFITNGSLPLANGVRTVAVCFRRSVAWLCLWLQLLRSPTIYCEPPLGWLPEQVSPPPPHP